MKSTINMNEEHLHKREKSIYKSKYFELSYSRARSNQIDNSLTKFDRATIAQERNHDIQEQAFHISYSRASNMIYHLTNGRLSNNINHWIMARYKKQLSNSQYRTIDHYLTYVQGKEDNITTD